MKKHYNETEEAFEVRKREAKKAILHLFRKDIVDDDEFGELLDVIEKNDEEDTVSIEMSDTTLDDASRMLSGMILYSVGPLYCEDKQIGTSISFHTNEQDEVSKFRHLSVRYDGRLLISEEY